MKAIIAAIAILFMAATGMSAQAASLLTNGGLESWGILTGTLGTPVSWYSNGTPAGAFQTTGLVGGSSYAAVMPVGGNLFQVVSTATSSFQFGCSFAATDPGANNRSFELYLYSGSGASVTPIIHLRTTQGASAGLLNLQAYSPSTGWSYNIATGLSASVFNAASDTFTTLNTYDLSISADFALNTYSVTYGLDGGAQTTVSNLSYFQTTPNGMTLGQVSFAGGASSSVYGFDNVSLISAPEPQSAALLMLGVATLLGLNRRKRSRV